MTRNKKKVLIISPFASPNLGGVESHLDKLLIANAQHGIYSVLITYKPLTTKANASSYQRFDDWEIYRQTWFGTGWFNILENYFPLSFIYLFPGLMWRSFLYYQKHHHEINCIHAHGLVAITIAIILKSIHPVRVVVSTHAVYCFSQRRLLSIIIKRILNQADYILAVSKISQAEIIALGINSDKVGVHPNWIDTEVFKPRQKHPSLKNIPFEFNCLFISRLIEKKGIKLFLDAALTLPEVGFHIVGDGPMQEEVTASATNNKNIFFYHKLEQRISEQKEKLIDLYSFADIFVAPYTYDEGFATTLIESCACGTPLIITDRGSPPTFLPKDGILLLPKYPQVNDVINALNKLKNNQTQLKKMSKIVRDHALSDFSPKNAEIIIKSYGL